MNDVLSTVIVLVVYIGLFYGGAFLYSLAWCRLVRKFSWISSVGLSFLGLILYAVIGTAISDSGLIAWKYHSSLCDVVIILIIGLPYLAAARLYLKMKPGGTSRKAVTLFLICLFILFASVFFFRGSDRNAGVRRAETKNRITSLCNASVAYQTEYSQPLPNDHAALVRILSGDNPRKIVFLDCDLHELNSHGEVTDAWGTPLQIDLTNPNHPIVRSAGRDKIFGTKDDLE